MLFLPPVFFAVEAAPAGAPFPWGLTVISLAAAVAVAGAGLALKRLPLVILLAGLLSQASVVIVNFSYLEDAGDALGSLLFYAWDVTPFVALWALGRSWKHLQPAALAVAVFALAGLHAFCLATYFISSDGQAGLIFIFSPIYEAIAAGMALLVAEVAAEMLKKKSGTAGQGFSS